MKFGAIFDWDGVIVDSSRAHERSWELLAKEEARDLPKNHFGEGFGRKNNFIIPEILKWTHDSLEVERLSKRKEELYRDVLGEMEIRLLPGVQDLLNHFDREKIPCVIGSSTEKKNIQVLLEKLKMRSHFQGIIAAEDVIQGKPNPEVFLKAAQLISVEPEYCVVFEDAPSGVAAAKAGGMRAVGVCTHHSKDKLKRADKIVLSLSEISNIDISTLFEQTHG